MKRSFHPHQGSRSYRLRTTDLESLLSTVKSLIKMKGKTTPLEVRVSFTAGVSVSARVFGNLMTWTPANDIHILFNRAQHCVLNYNIITFNQVRTELSRNYQGSPATLLCGVISLDIAVIFHGLAFIAM